MATLAAFTSSRVVKADAPTIQITGPSGTVFVSQFPYNTSIQLTISDGEGQLDHVNGLSISVDDGNGSAQLYSNINAFAQQGQDGPIECSQQFATSYPTGSCSVSAGVGTIGLPWAVPHAGSYTVTVSAKHQNDLGEDEEVATFQLVAVEYPAPPAIANAFINATPSLKSLNAKKRGCIISQIAQRAQDPNNYGPRPGPYNTPAIQSDVLAIAASGCAQ